MKVKNELFHINFTSLLLLLLLLLLLFLKVLPLLTYGAEFNPWAKGSNKSDGLLDGLLLLLLLILIIIIIIIINITL